MIDTRYATLDQRPKAFDVIGMNIPTSIDFEMMLNPKVLVANSRHMVVAGKFIGKESSVTLNIMSHEWDKSMTSDIRDNVSDNLTLSFFALRRGL